MAYVITEPCVDVKDLGCIQECPVDCIYVGASMVYIQPDECIDCGACEPVCPVDAIYYSDDVPDKWAYYRAANVDFFDDLGSPGGAGRIGPQVFDAPQVRGENLVTPPDSGERTSVALARTTQISRATYALAATYPPEPGGALGVALGLLFDGVVSIGEAANGAVA